MLFSLPNTVQRPGYGIPLQIQKPTENSKVTPLPPSCHSNDLFFGSSVKPVPEETEALLQAVTDKIKTRKKELTDELLTLSTKQWDEAGIPRSIQSYFHKETSWEGISRASQIRLEREFNETVGSTDVQDARCAYVKREQAILQTANKKMDSYQKLALESIQNGTTTLSPTISKDGIEAPLDEMLTRTAEHAEIELREAFLTFKEIALEPARKLDRFMAQFFNARRTN